MLSRSEVAEHASRKSCWVIIKGIAYDLTSFLDSHPGGSDILLKYAGKDATETFESIHSSDTLEKYIQPEQNMGSVSGPPLVREPTTLTSKEVGVPCKRKKPRLRSIINITDFERAASQLMDPKSFAFFKAGAEDELTRKWNQKNWQVIRFRPRILVPMERVDISTTVLGNKYSAPFFICPAGGGKLAHPVGEVLLTKAAAKNNILQWICNNAGCSQTEIADARAPGQVIYWQIYTQTNLAATEKQIKQAVANGYGGFALTVDAIRVGKRERALRINMEDVDDSDDAIEDETYAVRDGTLNTRPAVWPSFDWVSAVEWLRGLTDLPIAIKGIQSWEDAALCMHYGVHPYLSNHGGRQLEGAPSAVETLIEIREHCPEVFEKCEVIVDGGVTRGSDIVKALALGAKAVGIGRGFLYPLVFGEPGISKAIRILKNEVETTMALLGVTAIEQLNPSYVTMSARARI